MAASDGGWLAMICLIYTRSAAAGDSCPREAIHRRRRREGRAKQGFERVSGCLPPSEFNFTEFRTGWVHQKPSTEKKKEKRGTPST